MFAPPADASNALDPLELLEPLEREFFRRTTPEVAHDLIGAWLLRQGSDGLVGGRIVEAEAYGGPEDSASHARAGLTRRTTPMFGEVGHAYVYLVYGMHECLNVVAHAPPAAAGAVLIRAIEPILGVEEMRRHRGRAIDPDHRLAAGPARLCQALHVTRNFDGADLLRSDVLWLAAPPAGERGKIASGPRVGVAYAGPDWSGRPWRFWLSDNRSVSRR